MLAPQAIFPMHTFKYLQTIWRKNVEPSLNAAERRRVQQIGGASSSASAKQLPQVSVNDEATDGCECAAGHADPDIQQHTDETNNGLNAHLTCAITKPPCRHTPCHDTCRAQYKQHVGLRGGWALACTMKLCKTTIVAPERHIIHLPAEEGFQGKVSALGRCRDPVVHKPAVPAWARLGGNPSECGSLLGWQGTQFVMAS